MSKFKVGDRVVAVKAPDRNGKLVGKSGIIRKTQDTRLPIGVEFDEPWPDLHDLGGTAKKNTGWWCEEDSLERVNQKVVIVTDGSKTLATLYEGDKMAKTAKAKRNKEDAFNFAVGARLAFDRLMGEEKPAEEISEGGFKVGDLVTYRGHPGTVICLAATGGPRIGVEFAPGDSCGVHNCSGVKLRAGATGASWRCLWATSGELKHLKEKKEEHDMKFFPVDEIKDGYLLEIEEDGKTYYAITAHNDDGKLGWCSEDSKDYCYVHRFTETLVHRSNEDIKIRKIYGRAANRYLFDFSPEPRELLWERKDEPKKMTVAEVCKELGYDIEIVKE